MINSHKWNNLTYWNFYLSSSSDKTVKIWDAGSRQCVHTFYDHTDQVKRKIEFCMKYASNYSSLIYRKPMQLPAQQTWLKDCRWAVKLNAFIHDCSTNLNLNPVSGYLLFLWERKFILIAQCWLVLGINSRVISLVTKFPSQSIYIVKWIYID